MPNIPRVASARATRNRTRETDREAVTTLYGRVDLAAVNSAVTVNFLTMIFAREPVEASVGDRRGAMYGSNRPPIGS